MLLAFAMLLCSNARAPLRIMYAKFALVRARRRRSNGAACAKAGATRLARAAFGT